MLLFIDDVNVFQELGEFNHILMWLYYNILIINLLKTKKQLEYLEKHARNVHFTVDKGAISDS